MIALHREARDGAEQVGFLAEAVQMVDRLLDQQVGLPARAFGAEQRDEGLLARRPVLADPLAGLLLLPSWSSRSSAIWKARPTSRA